VHYQPIIDVPSARTEGFEALVRWQHPHRGLLLPGEFVSIAEDNGMIVPLGAQVLTAACRQLAAWQVQHGWTRRPYVSVNVSAVQLAQGDFPGLVARVLAETGLPPNALCLEITETSLMADTDLSRRVIERLRQLGVRLAIDDFGVGYSSLAYLGRFPIDVLKVDRSFITGMLHDRHEAAIVSMLVGLCRNLDLTIVAEGVEDTEQRDRLLQLGYTTMQGYLFGRPAAEPVGLGSWLPDVPRQDVPAPSSTTPVE